MTRLAAANEIVTKRPQIGSAAWSAARRQMLTRLVIVSLLVPLSFEVAGVRLTPALIILIGLFFPLTVQFFKQKLTIRPPDILFLAFVVWMSLTIGINNPSRFVVFTGQQALLILGGYLVGRVLVRDRDDFAALARFCALVAIISVPFALYEALTDDPVILSFILNYTPFNTFALNDYEERLGLHRAQWVFTHPIHYGMMSSLILPLYFFGLHNRFGTTRRLFGAAMISFACFLSVSSGAVLAIMIQIVVLIWYRVSQAFGYGWRGVIISGAALYMVLAMIATNSPLIAISSRLAFNPGTAYYRSLIWRYGSEQVARTPIFGNGYNSWPRPVYMFSSTVDNYWLLQAMVHGLPAVIFFLAAFIYVLYKAARAQRPNEAPELTTMRLAWILSMIGFALSASTVAIWGEIQLLFMIFFGAGLWLLDPDTDVDSSSPAEQPSLHPTSPHTRFVYKQPAVRGNVRINRERLRASGDSS